MFQNFDIVPAGTPFGTEKVKSIKVFAKDPQHLPIKIDHRKRYVIFYAEGEQLFDRIYNFEVRKDDIWVLTMPKCGTTWMMELVWLLLNDLDYETAMKVKQEARCPFLEFSAIYPSIQPNSLDNLEQCKSPRVIKSHFPIHLLPKGLWTVKPKIIYLARDPKDSSISTYHFMTGMGRNQADKEEFLNTVLRNEMIYGPFWKHIIEFWQLRNESYIYFTSFEKMKKDLRAIVGQVREFLEKPVLSNEETEKLLKHLSFDDMKRNPMCNHVEEIASIKKIIKAMPNSFSFIRKGEIGSHKEDLSEQMIKKFGNWTTDELKLYGLTCEEILYA